MTGTAPKPYVFVLMPVTPTFNDVFRWGVLDPCGTAGVYCERAGDHLDAEGIFEKLHHQIAKADLIVADLTGQDRNVMYALGYALALNKQAILFAQNDAHLPHDLRAFPHFVYAGASSLAIEFEPRLQWFLEHRSERLETADPLVDLYVCGVEIKDGLTIDCHEEEGRFLVEFGLFNRGKLPTADGALRLTVETPDEMPWGCHGLQHLRLPDTRWLYLLPPAGPIFPYAWDAKTLTLAEDLDPGAVQEAVVTLHTAIGPKRWKVKLRALR